MAVVEAKIASESKLDVSINPYTSAVELVQLLREKRVSSVSVLEMFIQRIELFDQQLPQINAVVVRDFARARERARLADEAIAKGEVWGPLHGLPMTVKEEMNVEGLPSTRGLPERKEQKAVQNCAVVQRLIQAGAIIFGKTNVPVHCADWQTYNPIHGKTRNPWDFSRSAGGSSGGSAVALAAGLTPLEVGGDLGGSIRVPAAFNGVWGLASTFGRISTLTWSTWVDDQHLVAAPEDMVVYGPMARTAADLQLLFGVLAFEANLSPREFTSLQGFRVALWRDQHNLCKVSAEMRTNMTNLVGVLKRQSVEVDVAARPSLDPKKSFDTYMRLVTGKDEGGNELSFKQWKVHREAQCAVFWQWRKFFEQFDFMIMPVVMCQAFPAEDEDWRLNASTPGRMIALDGGQRPYSDFFFWPHFAILAQLPAVAVPCGLANSTGTPWGVQILGPSGADERVLHFAALLVETLGGTFRVPSEITKFSDAANPPPEQGCAIS